MLGLLAVGLGQSGRHWVTGMLPQVPEIALAGCVDVDPAALRLAVEEAGVAEERCFTSLDDALSATDADAVLVATTLPGHVPVARAALEAGRHVLVEKPFAPTLAEAGELVALAERRGLVLMVNQNYRFFPAARAAADLVRAGGLGEPHEVEVDFRHEPVSAPGSLRSRGVLAIGSGDGHLPDLPPGRHYARWFRPPRPSALRLPSLCHRDFTHASSSAFSGYRWPPEVIVTAVRWYLSYPLSARQVTELLAERGIDVSARTVLTWTQTFSPLLATAARRHRRRLGRRWYIDEVFLFRRSVKRYLYRAVDEHGQVVDVLLREHRDLASAQAFFRRARATAETQPAVIVTDHHQPYIKAARQNLPGSLHIRTGLL